MEAYLSKRYGAVKDSFDLKPKKTKKKKKKKDGALASKGKFQGVMIVDDDAEWQRRLNDSDEGEEEAPTVVEEDEEVTRAKRMELLRRRTYLTMGEDGSGWVDVTSGKKSTEAAADLSPARGPRRARLDTPDRSPAREDLSPRRNRQDTPDQSPPRAPPRWRSRSRSRSRDDLSPPRRRSDSPDREDLSPPRHTRQDTPDLSPARKSPARGGDEDLSPPRTSGADLSDLSPPRRSQAEDLSPPRRRRRRRTDESESPRRGNQAVDLSPPRQRQRGDTEDLSPPRRKSGSDLSPPRRRGGGGGGDLSPPRRRSRGHHPSPPRRRSSNDLSPPRRGRADDAPDKAKAGLKTGSELRQEIIEKQSQDARRFKQLDSSLTGRGAETVYRDKHGRRLAGLEELMKQQKGPAKEPEKPLEWGTGLAQKREAEKRREEIEAEKDKPFARSKDDLDAIFKNRVRWGDPMAHLVKPSDEVLLGLEDFGKSDKMRESGFNVPQGVPAHSWLKRGHAATPNRFNIRPGRHWDGVDRSNGFEEKMFMQQNEKKAMVDTAYLWSVADM